MSVDHYQLAFSRDSLQKRISRLKTIFLAKSKTLDSKNTAPLFLKGVGVIYQRNGCYLNKVGIFLPFYTKLYQSLRITICHHLASLVMPNGDPRDTLF